MQIRINFRFYKACFGHKCYQAAPKEAANSQTDQVRTHRKNRNQLACHDSQLTCMKQEQQDGVFRETSRTTYKVIDCCFLFWLTLSKCRSCNCTSISINVWIEVKGREVSFHLLSSAAADYHGNWTIGGAAWLTRVSPSTLTYMADTPPLSTFLWLQNLEKNIPSSKCSGRERKLNDLLVIYGKRCYNGFKYLITYIFSFYFVMFQMAKKNEV